MKIHGKYIIITVFLISCFSSLFAQESINPMSNRMNEMIVQTVQQANDNLYDYNGDGLLNCIDHACIFKVEWDKKFPNEKWRCQIVRNKKDGVMHHLFVQITDEYGQIIEVESWSANPYKYLMSENWPADMYDQKFNIYGETEIWLADKKESTSSSSSDNDDVKSKLLYTTGVYGQTFKLLEKEGKNGKFLTLFMEDNKTNITTTYDLSLETVYYILSDDISDSREYSKLIEASKSFFDNDMNLIYLADMKDICDIAPCCTKLDYCISENSNNEKYILIAYYCSDLPLLFEIARLYNAKGRDYVMQKYIK